MKYGDELDRLEFLCKLRGEADVLSALRVFLVSRAHHPLFGKSYILADDLREWIAERVDGLDTRRSA